MCKNIPEIIKKCNEKEILIVSCGVNPKTNIKMIELRKKYPEIEICLGIYPLDGLKMSSAEIDKEINFIRKNRGNILGIGEIGLDLHSVKDEKSFDKQKKILIKFINLAKELDKPVFIHSRDAEEETIELLESLEYKKIIMHCFSGNMKLVKRIIENGWYLSIPSSVKYNEHFHKIVEITPMEKLFCETDSPFLHPDKIQGMVNDSSNVIESYKEISKIKRLRLDEVKKKIFDNFKHIR